MFYFSYGSNLSSKRLHKRVHSAIAHSIATLKGHNLKFHKVSKKDGSAKCDALETGNPNSIVHGVVYILSESDKPDLDKYEGLNHGYGQKEVTVTLPDGSTIQAFTYYATVIDPDLKPFDWYMEHVIRGAIEHGLPYEYIQKLASIDLINDTNLERKDDELSIYR